MRIRQLDDVQHAIELVESGMGWDELNESVTSLSEGEKAAIFLTKAKLSEEELQEWAFLAPAALQALRTAGTFAVKRALPAAGRFLKTKFGKGAAAGGGMAGGAEVVDRVVGGNDNDDGPDFGDGFDAGYSSAGGNRKSRFESDIKFNPNAGHRDQPSHPENRGLTNPRNSSPRPKLRPKNFDQTVRRADINKAVRSAMSEAKPNDRESAMDRALKQIEVTFGPERKKITDQVLAMCRAAEMMTNERWRDRALGQVEQYGIKTKEELVQELQLMIKNEKAVDDEYVTDTGTNIRSMERALAKISSLSEGWSELPRINREKYQERDGLEGPIMTRSGKVVYYDPKAGSYYDPDTDMYISYDDWRMLDQGNMHKINMDEGKTKQLHDIQWPDTDEDGDSEMATHAMNAIRHNFPAYDAYGHVYSMTPHRDWLESNKEELIDMFAGYGLPMDYDESVKEEKQRLDPKCWDGYKIGNPKTKMKGGVRVNNCVKK